MELSIHALFDCLSSSEASTTIQGSAYNDLHDVVRAVFGIYRQMIFGRQEKSKLRREVGGRLLGIVSALLAAADWLLGCLSVCASLVSSL